nr:hypothetical protein [Tanacetum cinerariifolium]
SPTDESKVRPLKEYTIKFPVMNGKNPLTFDFITFIESTRLDYAKDAYVSPPSPPSPKSQGPKASRSLPQKRKKLKSKKPPIETKVTPPPRLRGDKDLERFEPPSDMEPHTDLVAGLLRTGAEYQVDETQSTRLRYQTLTKNKGKTSSEAESGLETLQLTTLADIQAYLLSKDELVQESDKEEVFVARDDIEEDTQVDKE